MSLSSRLWFSSSALIALLTVIKGYYLFRFGPIADSNDLPHYLHYATLILGDQPWLSKAGLDEYMRQATFLRMIGYPALIALARLISQDHWTWILVIPQIALSLYASLWVWRLGVAVSGKRMVGFLAGLAYGTGLALRFDQMVLTDSPTASLLTIAFSILAITIITRGTVTVAQALNVGLLIAVAFLLRDSVRAIAFFYLPLIALAVWNMRPRWAAALRAGLILGPMIITMVSYQTWNELRTGERFITTIPHSAFMISMMKATQHGAKIFTEDTPLDRLAREEFKIYHFREVLYIVRRMQTEYGLTEPQLMKVVQAKYIKTWRLHPRAMLGEYIRQISPRQMLYVISPLFSDLDLRRRTQEHAETRPTSGREMIRMLLNEKSLKAYGVLALYAGQVLASLIVTAAFFLYPLVLIVTAVRTGRPPNKQAQVLIALWLFYGGMIALIALSEFTPRYLMPVISIVAIIGFSGLADFRRRLQGAPQPRH